VPAGFKGTLCRDGWAPYQKFVDAVHQTCLAHVLRRTREMRESNPAEHRDVPTALSEILHDALAARALRDTGSLSGHGLESAIAALEGRVDDWLASDATFDANRRLLKHVRKERSALFTFLRQSGVEATNWRARTRSAPPWSTARWAAGTAAGTAPKTQHILMTMCRTAYQQGADAIGIMIDLLRSPAPTIAPLAMPLTGKPGP